MQKCLLAVFFASQLFFAVESGAELVSGVAAIVNDDIITTLELNQKLAPVIREAEIKGQLTSEARQKLRTDVLNQIIDRRLAQRKLKELNIVVTAEEVNQSIEEVKKQNKFTQETLVAALLAQGVSFDQYKARMREQLEMLKLLSQEVKAKIQVSQREIREYYDANPARFSEQIGYRARHIFFRLPTKPSSDEVKKIMAHAADVMAEAAGGKDFIELARKNSDDPKAIIDGGDLGVFKKGDMLPEIEQAVINLKPGEVSDLVSTPSGFHIIKLEEMVPGKLKTFEEAKAIVEETLYREKSDERFIQWAADLRKSAAVDIK